MQVAVHVCITECVAFTYFDCLVVWLVLLTLHCQEAACPISIVSKLSPSSRTKVHETTKYINNMKKLV